MGELRLTKVVETSLEELGLKVRELGGAPMARRFRRESGIIGDITLDLVREIGGDNCLIGYFRVPISKAPGGQPFAGKISSYQGTDVATGQSRWYTQSDLEPGVRGLVVEEWARLTTAQAAASDAVGTAEESVEEVSGDATSLIDEALADADEAGEMVETFASDMEIEE